MRVRVRAAAVISPPVHLLQLRLDISHSEADMDANYRSKLPNIFGMDFHFHPQEDEDEDDDNLGRVSPTRSNLSGLSSGKMMSSRMLKSAVKPTSPYKDCPAGSRDSRG